MCRGGRDTCATRRCPSDTSAARTARRHNAKLRAANQGGVKQVEPAKLIALPVEPEPKTLKERAEEQLTLIGENLNLSKYRNDSQHALDQAVIELGAIVEEVAETHGAPTAEAWEEEIAKSVQLRTAAAKMSEEHRSSYGNPDFTLEDRQALYREASRLDGEYRQHLGQLTRMVEQRSAAYRAALEELGVEFAAPGTLNFDGGSSKDALKVFHDAQTFYPKAWVEASNRFAEEHDTPLFARVDSRRAHYASRASKQQMETIPPKTYLQNKPDGWLPDPENRYDHCYEPTDDPNVWKYTDHEFKAQEAKPRGPGWRQVPVRKKRRYVAQDGSLQSEDLVGMEWTRPRSRRRKNRHAGVVSEITTGKGERSTAVHELAHRMEHVTGHVDKIERAFFYRRTEGLERERIAGHPRGEVGYKDSFPHHYVGRDYQWERRDRDYGLFGAGPKHESYELLSMGMETVFFGKYGAGVGNNRPVEDTYDPEPDTDYRRFVLGTLASSMVPKESLEVAAERVKQHLA